jgi:hypothetical protein
MQDPRWSQLKQNLLERGWTWRDDTLYAPHETMWFKTSVERPNFANFRDRMSIAAEATGAYHEPSVDQLHLHDDLVSLVEALDEMLQN